MAVAKRCRAGALCVTWSTIHIAIMSRRRKCVRQARQRLAGVRVFSYPVWGWTLRPPRLKSARHLLGSASEYPISWSARRLAIGRASVADDGPDRRRPQWVPTDGADARPFPEFVRDPFAYRGHGLRRFATSIPVDYFEAMYAVDPDPWSFASSSYERDKYAATLDALPRCRYDRALEVGCSIGVFTRQLALTPAPMSWHSTRSSRRSLKQDTAAAMFKTSTFARVRAPDTWPRGSFDLIVLSEMVYYLDRDDIVALAERVQESISPGGDDHARALVGVHALSTERRRRECLLHRSVGWICGCTRISAEPADYRLDVLRMLSAQADVAA